MLSTFSSLFVYISSRLFDLPTSAPTQEISKQILKHSLANPLTVLKICLADALFQNSKSSALQKSQLALQYVEAVVLELLENKVRTFSCKQAIAEVISLLSDKQAQISLVIDSRLKQNKCLVSGSKIRLQEAISCLITNALRSYPGESQAAVIVTLLLDDGQLKIHIADYGCGMNYWQQKIAILPRVTLRSDGTGIGLSLAREVIEKEYKGSLQIISQKNIGTTICVKLPTKFAS